jgi:predicted MFS family arabinose efflux permease
VSAEARRLDTTVTGVQAAITLFLLIMAILMIPCSKLTDRWGRKRCFIWGLTPYGVGALVSAVSPSLGVLIRGNSVLEGVGTALLIPPVYILATMAFDDLTSRAKAFGVISGLGACVHLPSRRHRDDRLPEPAHCRPRKAGSEPPLRCDRGGPVGGRHVLRCLRDPAG